MLCDVSIPHPATVVLALLCGQQEPVHLLQGQHGRVLSYDDKVGTALCSLPPPVRSVPPCCARGGASGKQILSPRWGHKPRGRSREHDRCWPSVVGRCVCRFRSSALSLSVLVGPRRSSSIVVGPRRLLSASRSSVVDGRCRSPVVVLGRRSCRSLSIVVGRRLSSWVVVVTDDGDR